jgi:hypothetical protein
MQEKGRNRIREDENVSSGDPEKVGYSIHPFTTSPSHPHSFLSPLESLAFMMRAYSELQRQANATGTAVEVEFERKTNMKRQTMRNNEQL